METICTRHLYGISDCVKSLMSSLDHFEVHEIEEGPSITALFLLSTCSEIVSVRGAYDLKRGHVQSVEKARQILWKVEL